MCHKMLAYPVGDEHIVHYTAHLLTAHQEACLEQGLAPVAGDRRENTMTKSTMHKSQAFSVVAKTGVGGEVASVYGQKVEPALAVV